MEISRWFKQITLAKVSIAPLVTFRVFFGAIMFVSILRFWLNGWIEIQFIQPILHFKYFGFAWLPEPSAWGYYALFALLAFSALGIALGAFYRWSAVAFFLAFTYIELIDVSYYLNHYYFVSLVALIIIFLPAHKSLSVDVWRGKTIKTLKVNALSINILKFQLALVYVFAGIAKLNADWLFEAMPLAIWLPAQDQLPFVGSLFQYKATAYAFSWAGAIYDLTIPFFLLFGRTRWMAYAAVVVFHLLTWSLFQIGMFPFIMMGATLIFFSADFHSWLQRPFVGLNKTSTLDETSALNGFKWVHLPVAAFMLFQLTFPFRHLLYEGNMFWHEQGYRFGWRVMLMEKAGYAQFKIEDKDGRTMEVRNADFLTPVQEKMMSTQPDLMIQYAHFLKAYYQSEGISAEGVYASVYVTMNGQSSRLFIDSKVNLAEQIDGWKAKPWILAHKS